MSKKILIISDGIFDSDLIERIKSKFDCSIHIIDKVLGKYTGFKEIKS